MSRYSVSWLAVLLLATSTTFAAGLPDTGQNLCDNGVNVLAECTSNDSGNGANFPRQDGRFGPDAKSTAGSLTKIGGGAAGFDYSKIANNGSDLGPGIGLSVGTGSTDWACTRDNITGLMWEVKLNDASQLRDMHWTYTWYSSDGTVNGGTPGTTGGGICQTPGRCDTEKYIADVNTSMLCGNTAWRLPTQRELLTLVHSGTENPTIDVTYFPNTALTAHWSGTPFVSVRSGAWVVIFDSGDSDGKDKGGTFSVRLVRGGQF